MIISFLVDTDEFKNIEELNKSINDLEEALFALKNFRDTVARGWIGYHQDLDKKIKMNYSDGTLKAIKRLEENNV